MIAAALSPVLARSFSAQLPPDLALTVAYLPLDEPRWWNAVRAGTLVVLDPTVFAGDSVSLAMAGSVFAAAGARVVFYTPFSSESMHAVAFASVLMPVELWIVGIDDLAQQFANRVQQLAAHGLIADVLPRLMTDDDRLPQAVRAGVIALFTTPERFFEAGDLARVSLMSRRNLDRYLGDARLGTARRLIVAAKVLHGIVRFGPPGAARSSRSVADSLGYSDPEVFSRQFAEVFGVRPAARSSLSESNVMSSVLDYVRAPGESLSTEFTANRTSLRPAPAG